MMPSTLLPAGWLNDSGNGNTPLITTNRGIGMTSQRTRDRLVARLREEGIRNEAVLDVIRNTPRHLFVDEALASRAYEDTALPIGYNQTISQPYVVAAMTDLIVSGHPQTVLEIGTGSGYQAAVLAPLVPKIYTVERIKPLAEQARQRFRKLALRNIRASYSDGTEGLPDFAPYDAIITTAAAEEIPQALLEQLSPDGGRLVIPVGGRDRQTLTLVSRNGDTFESTGLDAVIFVPLLTGRA
jgi:protein-L-isoaspartate(D-aspartate) O-methyltransferase